MSRLELPGLLTAEEILATARSIAAAQEPSGAIPWFPGGHVDPWDHVECAMALSAAGLVAEAERAYDYLRRTQTEDGSWPRKLVNGVVVEATRETNQCAYVAVGVWHHARITGERSFIHRMWPTVRRGLDYVVDHQTDRGEMRWKVDPDGACPDEALLTGSSSTYQALRYGLALADSLGVAQPEWELAVGRLGHVLRAHPEAFLDKARYSMDWYYPILAGAVRGADALDRLGARWDDFVVPGLGARCVADQPWVTGAESCELVLTLDTVGDHDRAMRVLSEVQHLREPDGSYWTGYQFRERVNWPDEHSTWTAAAVVLAVDALTRCTAASGVFRADELPLVADLPDSACGCEPAVSQVV